MEEELYHSRATLHRLAVASSQRPHAGMREEAKALIIQEFDRMFVDCIREKNEADLSMVAGWYDNLDAALDYTLAHLGEWWDDRCITDIRVTVRPR